VNALGLEPRPDLAALLPPFASWDHPGRLDAGIAHAMGLSTARVASATDLVVVCRDGAALRRVIVPIAAVEVTPVRGIDPDAGLHVVRVEHAAHDSADIESGVWDAAVAAGRRAVAHQLAGACRTMLALARTHAVERMQFGRPIARFQAVRHRLAEALVAVEALEAALTVAWDEPGPTTAALAKASAGRTARTAATHCQQVLAGVGFTTDHPFHRFLKRALALEGLFGSADDIVVGIGRQLMAERTVPTLIEL
jgi:Acyl-CoA dehydrogenase, C-terminal domain